MEVDSIRLFIVLSVFLMLLWANLRRKRIEYFITVICLMFLIKDFYICLSDMDLVIWRVVLHDVLLDTYILIIAEGFLALRLFKYCLSGFCKVNFYIVCLISGLCIYMCSRLKEILDVLYLNEILHVSEKLNRNLEVLKVIIFLVLVSSLTEVITLIQWNIKKKNKLKQNEIKQNSIEKSISKQSKVKEVSNSNEYKDNKSLKYINKKDKCRRK